MRSYALKLFAITFAAVVALLVWVKSLAFPFHYLQSNDGWNNPAAVKEAWPWCLVQPNWVGDSGNFDALEWLSMETQARLWFMLAIWLVAVALTTYRYVRKERLKPKT